MQLPILALYETEITKMNILAVDQQPTLHAGGQERSLFEVLSALHDQNDAKITLCYQSDGELLDTYRQFIVGEHLVPFRVFSMKKLLPMVLKVATLYFLHLRKNWDVIYCNQYFDLPLFTLLSRLTGIRLVCHLRLQCPHYLSHQYRWGLFSSHTLLANSEAVKKSYVQAGIPEHKFIVIPNKINIRAWKPRLEQRNNNIPVIGYFGRLCKEKGILDLITAFGLMKQKAVLRITGNVRGAGTSDSFLDECRQKANQTGKADYIHFLPHDPHPKERIQECDFIVLPSWEESFGRIILEAMALEIPVIATDTGGIPEVLTGEFSKFLTTVQNPEALAEKMDTLADWRSRDETLGMRARKHIITHFSDYNLGQQIFQALQGVRG